MIFNLDVLDEPECTDLKVNEDTNVGKVNLDMFFLPSYQK